MSAPLVRGILANTFIEVPATLDAKTLDALFQYPRGKRRSYGLIRHWRNHVNHFHVRFRE